MPFISWHAARPCLLTPEYVHVTAGIARASSSCRTLSQCTGAGAHELKERTRVPLQTNLIAYSSHATEVKEWYWYPNSSSASSAATADGTADHAEGKQAGPVTKDELRTRFFQGKVTC